MFSACERIKKQERNIRDLVESQQRHHMVPGESGSPLGFFSLSDNRI